MQRTVMVLLLAVAAGTAYVVQPTTTASPVPAPARPGRVIEHISAVYDRHGNRTGSGGESVSGDSLYWKDYYSLTYLKSSAKEENPAPADRTPLAFQNNQTVVCMDPAGDYVYEVSGFTMKRFSTIDGSDTTCTLSYSGNGACATDGQYVYAPSGNSVYKYTTDGIYVSTTKIDFVTNTYAFGVANDTLWAGDFSGVNYFGYACSRFDGDSISHDAVWNVGGGTGGAGMNIAFDGTYYYWAMGGYSSNSFKRFYSDRTLYTVGMVSTDCRGVMCKVALAGRDVACTAVLAPQDSVDSGQTVTPLAVIRNVGTSEETLAVRLSIGGSYTDTEALTLGGGRIDTVEFEDWEALELGTFAVVCSTMLAGDVDPANDAVRDSVEVVPFAGIEERANRLAAFSCGDVRPNPTKGRAMLTYNLAKPTGVRISVFSTAGALIRRLWSGVQETGRHQTSWDGRDVQGRDAGSGVYLLRLEAGTCAATRELVVRR